MAADGSSSLPLYPFKGSGWQASACRVRGSFAVAAKDIPPSGPLAHLLPFQGEKGQYFFQRQSAPKEIKTLCRLDDLQTGTRGGGLFDHGGDFCAASARQRQARHAYALGTAAHDLFSQLD